MKDDLYTAYADATAEEAVVEFEKKYGYWPAEIKSGKTIWLVGPVREKESDDRGTDL